MGSAPIFSADRENSQNGTQICYPNNLHLCIISKVNESMNIVHQMVFSIQVTNMLYKKYQQALGMVSKRTAKGRIQKNTHGNREYQEILVHGIRQNAGKNDKTKLLWYKGFKKVNPLEIYRISLELILPGGEPSFHCKSNLLMTPRHTSCI